jgi:hypothetical protein
MIFFFENVARFCKKKNPNPVLNFGEEEGKKKLVLTASFSKTKFLL